MAGRKKNMVTRRLGSVLILRQGKESPTDEEWDECLRLLSGGGSPAGTKVLVVTDGGGPSATQRKRLEQALAGYPVPVAIVSESARVRFVASAVALLTSRICSFRSSELPKAYDFLSLTDRERSAVEQNLGELGEMVD